MFLSFPQILEMFLLIVFELRRSLMEFSNWDVFWNCSQMYNLAVNTKWSNFIGYDDFIYVTLYPVGDRKLVLTPNLVTLVIEQRNWYENTHLIYWTVCFGTMKVFDVCQNFSSSDANVYPCPSILGHSSDFKLQRRHPKRYCINSFQFQ